MNDKIKRIVSVAIFSSIAIVLSIIESLIPFGIPGVKLGLANVVTLVVLFIYGYKESIFVQYIRILLVGLLYSGIISYSFLISLVSGTVSLAIMVGLYFIKKLSIPFISVISALFHSLTEILVAYLILHTNSLFLYLPILLITSLPFGLLSGYLSILVLKSLRREYVKPKLAFIIIISTLFTLSLSIDMVLSFKKEAVDEGKIAIITYDNKEIMNINLDDPTKYKVISADNFIEATTIGSSYLFTFNVYNKDEKAYYDLVVEIKDSSIRVKDETSKKHIGSKTGFISTKYQSIVCLPNSFVVTINYLNNDEIDAIM